MESLADKIIQQNEKDSSDTSEYYLDDLGYLVEKNIKSDKTRLAEYALFRIRKLHPNIYTLHGRLFCGHEPIICNREELYRLIDYPDLRIDSAQTAWVYNRLKEIAQPANLNLIRVAPNMAWDCEKAELIFDLENITTIED